MLDFAFYSPTRVLFGRESMNSLSDMLKQYGATKVMVVHYGEASPPAPIGQTLDILKANNIPYIEFADVRPNPIVERVYEGIGICRESGADFLLAVGGGSVIDTAKGIAAGVKLPAGIDIWDDYYLPKNRFSEALPLGVVLTFPATGSETSFGTCMSKGSEHLKRYTGGEPLIPKFSIMNPEFTLTIPPYETASAVADIWSHMAERYFTHVADVDFTDRMIEAGLKSIMLNGAVAVREPNNYAARAEVMWAASVAHNGIMNVGRTLGDWASHDIGHELSGFYDLPHGVTLAIITPAWMKYVYKNNPMKFEQFARRVFGVDVAFDRQEEAILEMISRVENFFVSIGLPVRISEAGIDGSCLAEMAKSALIARTQIGGSIKALTEQDVLEIYKLAL